MIKRLLIANRGEIARRIIRTAHRMGIETVAIYSEVDEGALHVKEATRAFCVGPALASQSYLNIPAIMEVAKKMDVDAIHPGYGFLSENPDFARACVNAGIIFVGPSADAIEAMGSKARAKEIVQAAGMPLIPGYHGVNQDPDHLFVEAKSMGTPLMIKAVMGGGGKGMRLVEDLADFQASLASCKREAISAFGDDRVLLEKYIEKPRHIEVQVFGDTLGNYVHLFERDCSLQRRHQKIIEEAPGFGLDEGLRTQMGEAAIHIARAVNYVGAGTVEFLADAHDQFYFMEMNTRLQVEHPVTEEITGLDLVEWQLRVASNESLPLSQNQITHKGHAIECRIYAEDPHGGFLPSTGTLSVFAPPHGEYRLESGVSQGDMITSHYDPMIAKLVVKGETREEALLKAASILDAWPILGVKTNITFLSQLLKDPDIQTGSFDVGFLDQQMARWMTPQKNPKVAARCLAIALKSKEGSQVQDPWVDTTAWQVGGCRPQVYNFVCEGEEFSISLHYDGTTWWVDNELPFTFEAVGDFISIHCPSATLDAYVHERSADVFDVWFRGQVYSLNYKDPLNVAASLHEDECHLRAPMTSKVISIGVEPEQHVVKDQTLMIIEAMKMEHAIKAPSDGRVGQIYYALGDTVSEGQDLLEFHAEETHDVLSARG